MDMADEVEGLRERAGPSKSRDVVDELSECSGANRSRDVVGDEHVLAGRAGFAGRGTLAWSCPGWASGL